MHASWHNVGSELVGAGDGLTAAHQEMRGLFDLVFTEAPRLARRALPEL